MQWLRCPHLLIEPAEVRELDQAALLRGQPNFVTRRVWRALCSHRDGAFALTDAQLALLGRASPREPQAPDLLRGSASEAECQALLDAGLLREVNDDGNRLPADVAWHPLAAVLHRQCRWSDVDSRETDARLEAVGGMAGLEALFGPVPDSHLSCGDPAQRLALPYAASTSLSKSLQQRSTCRNFDRTRALALQDLATVLGQVYGVQAEAEVSGLHALKKARAVGGRPASGGSLRAGAERRRPGTGPVPLPLRRACAGAAAVDCRSEDPRATSLPHVASLTRPGSRMPPY
jgi:hypothetical protein